MAALQQNGSDIQYLIEADLNNFLPASSSYGFFGDKTVQVSSDLSTFLPASSSYGFFSTKNLIEVRYQQGTTSVAQEVSKESWE